MFGDVDDRVCWVVISDVGLWYVDGNCYLCRLSLVGVLLVLRFLFGSVCSNDGSSRRGAMIDVLSSNFSISRIHIDDISYGNLVQAPVLNYRTKYRQYEFYLLRS